jgi:hypothetical protein
MEVRLARRPVVALMTFTTLGCPALCQGTWEPPYDTFNGGTPVRSAFGIHLIHVRPASPGMGNKGKFLYWGRSDTAGAALRPFRWTPGTVGTFGTIDQTLPDPSLAYEAFCCGQALLKDGSPIICGANFDGEGRAQVVVSTYNIATNTRPYDNATPDSSINHGIPPNPHICQGISVENRIPCSLL